MSRQYDHVTDTSQNTEAAIRRAFTLQASLCRCLKAPFTAAVCEVLGGRMHPDTQVGRHVFDWKGAPSAQGGDSVPLRLVAGLQALVRAGGAPVLAAMYPPNSMPDKDALWWAIQNTLESNGEEIVKWLALPPQTNEVARSSILMAGLIAIRQQTNLPLWLYEIGASAGLNLVLDRYRYSLGERDFGAPQSSLCLTPNWEGPPLPQLDVEIVRRRGVDLAPLRLDNNFDLRKLAAYIWTDHADRLARLNCAIDIAAEDPPMIDAGDASSWVEANILEDFDGGVTRVLMHSIAFQYFSAETKTRLLSHIRRIGEAATKRAPFAWLRFEGDVRALDIQLTLTLWPGGEDKVLASGDAHGRNIKWIGVTG